MFYHLALDADAILWEFLWHMVIMSIVHGIAQVPFLMMEIGLVKEIAHTTAI